MIYKDLPSSVQEICDTLVEALKDILCEKLYGVYMYGAPVFPDSGPVTDIDCHVILRESLNDQTREDILLLYRNLSEDYPLLGGELDIWYILLSDAQKNRPPPNQLKANMHDESWALHRAHIRAGRYVTLYGPEPDDIFPTPSWDEIRVALDHELGYIKNNLKYPAYCVLNLCRIMYSYQEKNVVVSKRFSGLWADEKYPEWSTLIQAAQRTYEGKGTPSDENRLKVEKKNFLEFALQYIDKCRKLGRTHIE